MTDRLSANLFRKIYDKYRARKIPKGSWTLQEALEFITPLQEPLKKAGFYMALGGSVLYSGHSESDLDLIVYPSDAGNFNYNQMRDVFYQLGLRMIWSRAEIASFWERKNSQDLKNVEVWVVESTGKRVDVFLLK